MSFFDMAQFRRDSSRVYDPQPGVGAGTTGVDERQRLLHLFFEEVHAVGSGADVRAEIFRASDGR